MGTVTSVISDIIGNTDSTVISNEVNIFETIKVKVKKIYPEAKLPEYKTLGAAGFDLHALLPPAGITVKPGERVNISTGLSFEIPVGYEVQIRSRSGLAIKQALVVLNAPGTIDSDYRGEIIVCLINHDTVAHTINNQDRIAQGILAMVEKASFLEVEELGNTERGSGGFGSTGR